MTCIRQGCEGSALDNAKLCYRCAWQLSEDLTVLTVEFNALSIEQVVTGPSEATSHQKINASPALCRLDVVALQDPRTRWDGDPDSPRYVPGLLRIWQARLQRYIGGQTGSLATEWDAVLGWPLVGQLCVEARGLAKQVSRLVGGPPPREIPTCSNGHVLEEGTQRTNSQGARVCKVCAREASARYRERRAADASLVG